jgi:hypothetical protein
MEDPTKTQEMFAQLAARSLETMTVWAETNQRVLREIVELSAGSAKESLKLYAELSRGTIEALRESQAAALRWQAGWLDASKDPSAWLQRAVTEGVNGTQQAFRRVEEQAQAVTRTAERLQAGAEQAGKGIQESLAGAVSRMKEIYATA